MKPDPPAAARTRDPEGTRSAILDAAETAFCSAGFSAAALSEIAAAAGVAKSLIHHHFGSKEELWRAVLERRFAAYGQLQWDILSRPELDLAGFEESVRALFDFLAANPEFVRLHAWANAGRGGEELGKRELVERGVERLRGMQRSGTLADDLDPAAVLVCLFNLVEHWFQAREVLSQRFGDILPDPQTYLESMVRILIRGVRP